MSKESVYNGNMWAFPNQETSGMTKREYFAGLAMQGMLSKEQEWATTPQDIAATAVKCADALLEALEATHE